MNIQDKNIFRSCTSCGVCATVCSKRAITMQLGSDGFYRPHIDESLCNDCGLCISICYKFDRNVQMTLSANLTQKPLYSAWSNDDELVKSTTSGGIGDLLARQLLKDGYNIVGVAYNEDKTRAEHRIAKKEKDIYCFRGSKYIQSYTYEAFKEVVSNCRKEKYAVFGTPCQIYALSKLATQRKVRENFFFIDLYCHGCPSIHAWTKYQNSIKKKEGIKRFNYVNYRSKAKGGGMFKIEARDENGNAFLSSPKDDFFYELFFSDIILNDACDDCLLRSTLEYTDIRLGDFWGHKFLDNQRGVSAVSLCTEKGMFLFDQLKSDITCSRCSYDDFLPYQSWNRTYDVNSDVRKELLSSLSKPQNELSETIKILRHHQGMTATIKRYIKSVFALLPLGFTNSIKKIVYKFRNN